MLKKYSQIFEAFFTATDLFVASAAWLLSYWIRFYSGFFAIEKGIPPISHYLKMLIFVWLIWAFVFRQFGLYKPMRGRGKIREAWMVIRANSLSILCLVSTVYLFKEKDVEFSRLVFLIFWVASNFLIIALRLLMRKGLRVLRKRGYNKRYVLIVGAEELAHKFAKKILKNPEYGMELIGCLARNPQKHLAKQQHFSNGLRILGSYSDLSTILEENSIDQIIVALPLVDNPLLTDIIKAIGDTTIDVKIVPDIYKFIQLGSQIDEFDGLPVVTLAATPLQGLNKILKRVFDFHVGLLLFILALPLMLVLAVLIKVTTRGPVLYSQERVSLDGTRFVIYKFCTMVKNAEATGAKFATKGDSRVTKIGKILRKLNLDELPQLANVITGTMSLVGPRPERPVFIEEFKTKIPKYMLRHKVQAGMTGWAQVNGWRGNTSIERRIEHDLYYIENWSIGFDIKILGLTFIKSFRDRNAY